MVRTLYADSLTHGQSKRNLEKWTLERPKRWIRPARADAVPTGVVAAIPAPARTAIAERLFKMHARPRPGVRLRRGSAIAVLAGAGIAAATDIGAASASAGPIQRFGLSIVHFSEFLFDCP
jgi:hypothetical protein